MTFKTVVVYHYFEKDSVYRDNLIFFLANGVHSDAYFYIIISGECSVPIPSLENVTVIRTRNWNHDFGGYIQFVRDHFSENYEYYIFINSSMRGPFIPSYVDGIWNNYFTSKLEGDIKLVGASINTMPSNCQITENFYNKFGYPVSFPHVQTTAYALTKEAMLYLIRLGFFDVRMQLTKEEVIVDYELRLSQEIIRNGWNIGTILPLYKDIDYRNIQNEYPNFSSRNGDVLYSGCFFGRSITPTEGMFVKTNRNMINKYDLASYTFTSLYDRKINSINSAEVFELLNKTYDMLENREKSLKKKIARKVLNLFNLVFRHNG